MIEAPDLAHALAETDTRLRVYDFRDSPTIEDFIHDENFVAVLKGPVGGGKTYGSCFKLMKLAQEMPPSPRDYWRKFKVLIVRNTLGDLKESVLDTWLELWPERDWGRVIGGQRPEHRIRIPPAGGVAGLELHAMFRAFDIEKSVRSLFSAEYTFIYLVEARFLIQSVMDNATSRVGRYPNMDDRPDPETHGDIRVGVIADTNAWDGRHWLEQKRRMQPAEWAWYDQPPAVLEMERTPSGTWRSREPEAPIEVRDEEAALIDAAGRKWLVNPAAENLRHLDRRYYARQLPDKTLDWIQCLLQGRNVWVREGEPVIPEWRETNISDDLQPIPDVPLLIGADVGGGTLNNAFVIAQMHPTLGAWFIHHELYCPNTGLDAATTALDHLLAQRYPDFEVGACWGDPAGEVRDGHYEVTAFQILADHGYRFRGAPDKTVKGGIEAIKHAIGRNVAGRSALVVHRRCERLIGALAGRWHYKIVVGGGTTVRYSPEPVKNDDSHLPDALRYLLLGGGEWKDMTRGRRRGARAEERRRGPATPEPKSNVRIKPWGRR